MKAKKNPAFEEAGCVDPVGSVAVAAGPDQREAVVALTLHQRGVDRGREARIVEFDREVFAFGLPRGLLPGGAELGGAGENAIVGRLVVVLLGRNDLGLAVELGLLDRAGVAVVRCGKGSDGSHGGLRLLSGRDHRGLDGGPWPGERSARSRQARSAAEDGGRRFFCLARNAATLRQGKKAGVAVGGRLSRRSRPPVLIRPFEVA